MKMKQETIEEIADSYINGNISWCKKQVKKMSKLDFFHLVTALESRTNEDSGHMIYILLEAMAV